MVKGVNWQARDAQDLSRAALNRYLHYCNRFMNHQQSLKLEYKLYSSVKVRPVLGLIQVFGCGCQGEKRNNAFTIYEACYRKR